MKPLNTLLAVVALLGAYPANPASAQSDLDITINQSILEKIVSSLDYPFVVLDDRSRSSSVQSKGATAGLQRMPRSQLVELVRKINSPSAKALSPADLEIKKLFDKIIGKSEKLLSRMESGKIEETDDITIPRVREFLAFLKGESAMVSNRTLDFLCFDLDYKISRLRVEIRTQPDVSLGNKRMGFRSDSIFVKVWIDVIIGHPSICCKCSIICCPWPCCDKSTIQLRPSATLTASGYAWPENRGSGSSREVAIFGHFNSLRINHPLLGWIPLEGFANKSLKDKSLAEISYKQLAQRIDKLDRTVSVESIEFISAPRSLPMKFVISSKR